ncbi:MAG: DMT family transporter [Thermodesulfobacteriota bacterium]
MHQKSTMVLLNPIKPSPLRRAFDFFERTDLGEKKAFSITDVYLLLAVIIWGSDYLFAKIALREVSPISFSAMRTAISTAVLIPFFVKREKNWSVSVRHFSWLVGLALLGTVLNRIFWAIGLSLTTASNSALLMATSPIFVLIGSSIFLRTVVTSRAVLGILLSFVGVFLMIQGDWKGGLMGSETFRGDLIIIAAAVLWALFTVLAKKLLKEYSSLKVTAYVMLIGTILFLPFLPNEKGGGWGEISWLAWFSVLYVAILGNCLAYFFWIWGIQNIGPMRTGLYQYLMPVVTILLAVPFLKETLTAIQVWGAAVVFGGIFLARFE